MFIPRDEKIKRINKTIGEYNGQIPFRTLSEKTEINYPTLRKLVEELGFRMKKNSMTTTRKMLVVYS